MRTSDDTRDAYIALADRVERSLRLAEFSTPSLESSVRDTFPFQERAQLHSLESLCRAGNLT
jgi:hypothetical protein